MAYGNPYARGNKQLPKPYSCRIPGGLTNGKLIHIHGSVQDNPDAKNFSINLSEKSSSLQPNCALHFNPRFNENCIVRNAMIGGKWGKEERGGEMPLTKGQNFAIIIMCTPYGYRVAVNGRHFTEFKHRLAMRGVEYLFIDGDYLMLTSVEFEEESTS